MRQFIKAGRLPSKQYGRDHVIKESDLALVAERKNGRPSKKAATTDGEVPTATDAPNNGTPSPAIEAPAPKLPKKARKASAKGSKKGKNL